MFSCLQILEAFLWFVLITLLNVTLIILTLSVSRLLNLLLRLVAFLLFLNPQCLASISRWITASSSWKRFCLFVCRALSSIMVICMLTAIRLLLTFVIALRLSPLRRGLAIDSTVDIFTFYVPHRHVYGEQWIKFMKDGVNATPLPTVNTTGYIDHAAFLGTINPDTNKIPKHLFQGYLNIYNNYFKAPWMPDRTEANPNELNQDDARYGFRCCHLKNIWTAPLPPETELSRQMTT